MLDMKGMREQIDLYKQKLQSRGVAAEVVDELVALDEKRRELIQTSETLKQRRNDVSSTIGEKKRAGESAEDAIAEMQEVAAEIRELDEKLAEIEERLQEQLSWLPN